MRCIRAKNIGTACMPHAHWYMIDLPEAQEAIEVQARFFLRHLGAAPA